MAGLVLWGATFLIVKSADKIQQRRSIVLPTPQQQQQPPQLAATTNSSSTDSPDLVDIDIGPEGKAFTFKQLKALCRAWQSRLAHLTSAAQCIEAAIEHGRDVCWAGKISDYPQILNSQQEAKYISTQLSQAVQWCRAQSLRKSTIMSTFKPSHKHNRIKFESSPPSLSVLPWPLPQPPRANNDYHLVMQIPESFRNSRRYRGVERWERPEDVVGLPLYSPDVDTEKGERMLDQTPMYSRSG